MHPGRFWMDSDKFPTLSNPFSKKYFRNFGIFLSGFRYSYFRRLVYLPQAGILRIFGSLSTCLRQVYLPQASLLASGSMLCAGEAGGSAPRPKVTGPTGGKYLSKIGLIFCSFFRDQNEPHQKFMKKRVFFSARSLF